MNKVARVSREALHTATLHDELKLTVIGPAAERLHEFIDTWTDEVHKALVNSSRDAGIVSPALEAMGSSA